MKMSKTKLEIRVGLFASLGVVLAMVAIWMLGSAHDVFSKKSTYYINLPSAEGLVPGATVNVAGVQAGTVDDITLRPSDQMVSVKLLISSRFAGAIREDSIAHVTSHGVLGDKIVSISAGRPDQRILPAGEAIPARATSTVGALVGKSGEDLIANMNRIAIHLDQLLESITEGGKSKKLMDNLISSSKNLSLAISHLDQQLDGIQLKSAVKNLNSILAKIDHGEGTASGLINDPALYNDAKALIGESNRNRIVRNLVRQSVKEGHEREQKEQAGEAAHE